MRSDGNTLQSEESARQSGEGSIGRYGVVGRLAMGGMAEILLGRLLGPSGFERVVVIKRVLPHLAQQPSFTSMFLDEARIAAAIRHPNVVQVHELGQDGGELFLVMEYLEGESLHGLMRRLTLFGERLPPALVAHIGAEACAGLHAAHELPDADGNPSGLVHRDISPQNVFIGYDGSVKILDFGIAKAADRITQTEAGTLKGKFSYMSPEQCLGDPLDRRSDLFALGIVLYEAVTGRRLFHREAQLKTLDAVVRAPFPTPSELDVELPAALEAAILRALERDRDARFETAAEMRRALAEARADGPAVPDEALAELMQRLFADRIEEKSEMLRRVRAGSDITSVPEAEIDVEIELPTVGALPAPSRSEPAPERAPSPLRRLGWIVAVILAAGLTTIVALSVQPDEPGPMAQAPALPTSAGAAAPPSPAPVAAPAEPETVSLHVDSDPSGAQVQIDGEDAGETPLDVQLAREADPVVVHVSRGALEAEERIVPDRDQHVRVILVEPAPRPRARRRRTRRAPTPTAPPAPADDGFARFD